MSNKKYDSNNIFAKIIKGEIPAKKLYEDDKILAFYDISPMAPTHVLVIPKGDFTDYSDFINKASPELQSHYFKKIAEIIKNLGISDGYKLLANTGTTHGQTVFHFHMHILSESK